MDKMGGTDGIGLIVYTGTRDELCRKLRERDDRITKLEAALLLVDADVRHHLRDAYENADSIPAAMIRPQAIKAVRDALRLSQ